MINENNLDNKEKRLDYILSKSFADYVKQMNLLYIDLRMEYLKDFVRVFCQNENCDRNT